MFARKSFHATTIGDIANEAGLAYGLAYWYFASKDDLFHALMVHWPRRACPDCGRIR